MCCYSAVRRTLLAEFSSSFRSFYLFSRRRSHQQLFRSNRRFFCMANEPPAKRTKKEIADTSDNNGTDVSIVDTFMTKRLKVCKSVTDFKFDKKRVRLITSNADMPEICKGIAYWMWREQRVQGEPKKICFLQATVSWKTSVAQYMMFIVLDLIVLNQVKKSIEVMVRVLPRIC